MDAEKENLPVLYRQPGRRTHSNEEMEARIELVASMLSFRLRKSDIKRELKALYGLCHQTCEYYLRRARELLRERGGISKKEQRINSLAFYEEVIRNSSTSITNKIRAQERIDLLCGLEPARKTELTGKNGKPIQVEQYVTEVEIILGSEESHHNGSVHANGSRNGSAKTETQD